MHCDQKRRERYSYRVRCSFDRLRDCYTSHVGIVLDPSRDHSGLLGGRNVKVVGCASGYTRRHLEAAVVVAAMDLLAAVVEDNRRIADNRGRDDAEGVCCPCWCGGGRGVLWL